jgi:hypothetical protein
MKKTNLGRIGQLADELRFAAQCVTDEMRRTPGGDAFEYQGSTMAVEDLIEKINALEHFQAGWVE